MLKIEVDRHNVHLEFGKCDLSALLAELSMGINKLYNAICDKDEEIGAHMKTMLQMGVLDNSCPMWERARTDTVTKVEVRLPKGLIKEENDGPV